MAFRATTLAHEVSLAAIDVTIAVAAEHGRNADTRRELIEALALGPLGPLGHTIMSLTPAMIAEARDNALRERSEAIRVVRALVRQREQIADAN